MNQTETFQHYQVLRREDGTLWELGRGAMGVTYKAFDTSLRCEVALKVISTQFLHSEIARQRFIREARAAAQLRHRNIATVYHLGMDERTFFYSMEFIGGETLDAMVKRAGPLPPETVLRIALQTARALAAASRQGLIHRDIKPANLMVLHEDDDGEDALLVKVIDFGLARSFGPDDSSVPVTVTGFVGTPQFASPEQLDEEDLDVRSDIYSLGVTLWFLLTGRAPFTGKLTHVISQHLSADPPWWQLENCPLPVRALLKRMLRKTPADRHQSAVELRREIEACLQAFPGTTGAGVGTTGAGTTGAGTTTGAPVTAVAGAGVNAGGLGSAAVASAVAAATLDSAATQPGGGLPAADSGAAGSVTAAGPFPEDTLGERYVLTPVRKKGRRGAGVGAGADTHWRVSRLGLVLAGTTFVALGVLCLIYWGRSPVEAVKVQAARTKLAGGPFFEPAPASPPPLKRPEGTALYNAPGPQLPAPTPPPIIEPSPPVDDGAATPVVAVSGLAPSPAGSESPAATASPADPGADDGDSDDTAAAADAKKDQPARGQTRSRTGSRRHPTPRPNFFQRLFGIKPKPTPHR